MDITKWLSALAALVVAVTSILVIWPDDSPPPTEEGQGLNLSGDMEIRYVFVTSSSPEDASYKVHFKAKRIGK